MREETPSKILTAFHAPNRAGLAGRRNELLCWITSNEEGGLFYELAHRPNFLK